MSAKKKKAISLWSTCDLCQSVVLQKDISTHKESSCPPKEESWLHPYIRESRIYTILDTFHSQDESLKNLPSENKNEFVLIPTQALQLACIPIGDPVLVSLGKNIQFIKTAWPAGDKKSSLLSVAVSKEVAELYSVSPDTQITLIKYNREIKPAQEIVIESISETNLTLISELISKIHEQNIDNIYCVGNKFIYRHYGKKYVFTITKIHDFSQGGNLEDDLSKLGINEKFYVVVQDTKWTIEGFTKDNCKEKNLLEQIGGLQDTVYELEEIVSTALSPSTNLPGVHLTKGVLVFGPGGTGKSLLINAIAQKFTPNIIRIECSEIFSKYLGETEKKLQSHFEKAIKLSPSIILIDELDGLCPKSSSRSEQEKRIVTTLSLLMDKLHSKNKSVVVLATTSKINHIDKSLRRPGRFGKEIEIYVPNMNGRFDILKKLLNSISHNLTDEQIKEISDAAHGFVGADLMSVVSKAVMRNFQTNGENSLLSVSDLSWTLPKVKPSAMREILIEVPNVKWSDIGGQHDLKLKLKQAVEWPLKHSESFKRLGISPPRGVLMFGPPGCSKTMIAKALATESNLNFISVKGPELFSKWVGESEKAVREVFRRARQAAPSIVFFDELDALGGERGSIGSGSNVQERVLAQLLTELDGVEPLGNVTVVGATNRPDRIDPALLRPGRLDRIIYVPLPDKDTRREIFTIQLRKTPVAEDVSVEELIEKTEGYSGAELVAVCHEAALKSLEEDIEARMVFRKHFESALTIIVPRTSDSLLKIYEKYIKVL